MLEEQSRARPTAAGTVLGLVCLHGRPLTTASEHVRASSRHPSEVVFSGYSGFPTSGLLASDWPSWGFVPSWV